MSSQELAKVARAALDWIDAVPAEIAASLPTMPGFDRDWAEEAIKEADSVSEDVESILTLLESDEWAEHCTKTPLGNRLESVITELVAKSHIQPMPDHEIRETVNQLRDIAKAYGHTEQLRDRIAYCIVDKLKCVPAREVGNHGN